MVCNFVISASDGIDGRKAPASLQVSYASPYVDTGDVDVK